MQEVVTAKLNPFMHQRNTTLLPTPIMTAFLFMGKLLLLLRQLLLRFLNVPWMLND
jgi:hypothetical protein